MVKEWRGVWVPQGPPTNAPSTLARLDARPSPKPPAALYTSVASAASCCPVEVQVEASSAWLAQLPLWGADPADAVGSAGAPSDIQAKARVVRHGCLHQWSHHPTLEPTACSDAIVAQVALQHPPAWQTRWDTGEPTAKSHGFAPPCGPMHTQSDPLPPRMKAPKGNEESSFS